MIFVFGTGQHPLPKQQLLFRTEDLVRLRGRHQLLLVISPDAIKQLTVRKYPGIDRPNPITQLDGSFTGIKPEISLAVVRIGPVAQKTVTREDRANVTVEVNLHTDRTVSRNQKSDKEE